MNVTLFQCFIIMLLYFYAATFIIVFFSIIATSINAAIN